VLGRGGRRPEGQVPPDITKGLLALAVCQRHRMTISTNSRAAGLAVTEQVK
jgi:hypothetical protein